MRIGWLADDAQQPGGAELTQSEFFSAAPEGIEMIDCPPEDIADCDHYAVHNCVTYGPETIEQLQGKPVIRYHNDLSPHGDAQLRTWLDANATHIFCSPLQRSRYKLDGEWPIIPPALDLQSFRPPRQVRRHGERGGTISVGAWGNPGKGSHLLEEWAREKNEAVDVYGEGPCLPAESPTIRLKGPLAPRDVAQTLWSAKRFVFLPTAVEPFGRSVVEAYLAGCEVITNKLVGGLYWLEHPGLETAAEDFWKVCLN